MSQRSVDRVTIRLGTPVPGDLSDELRRRMYFVSEAIEAFEFGGGGQDIDRVTLKLAHGTETAEAVAAKVERVVAGEILKQRRPTAKCVWTSPSPHRAVDVYPEMLRRSLAFETGDGQVGFGEPVLSLMDHLDARLRRLALGFANAREYRYPTLIPTAALDVSGYIRSFPHFVMFTTRLHNDIDVYQKFLADYAARGALPASVFSHCGNRDYCLPPTMCYHTFQQLRQHQLAEDAVVTAKGKSFRFESKYSEGLARLWDFTIREIVFLGSCGFVVESRRRFMDETFALMTELGLSGRCEVASDHFFANADTADRISTQLMMELKYELRLDIAPGKTIAAGSFNFHDQFFARSFAIRDASGAPLTSGCVGFGLERLTYCFLCQHGLDPAAWPIRVAAS